MSNFSDSIHSREIHDYNIHGIVNSCPSCNKGIKPTYISHVPFLKKLVVIESCPLCQELIISIFKYDTIYLKRWMLYTTYPYNEDPEKFSSEVTFISESFVNIYNQAKLAETVGLKDICGMGYRKALEHLVKDYAKLEYPEESSSIDKRPLKQCIEAYIQHPKMKSCILGATYLGNDETHYIRKIANKDIEDLKILIKLSTLWITMNEATKKYELDPELNIK
jgi:hypothetical protein